MGRRKIHNAGNLNLVRKKVPKLEQSKCCGKTSLNNMPEVVMEKIVQLLRVEDLYQFRQVVLLNFDLNKYVEPCFLPNLKEFSVYNDSFVNLRF